MFSQKNPNTEVFIVRGSVYGGFDVDGQICGGFDSCMIIMWLLRK